MINLRQVSKSYDNATGGFQALRGINLHIRRSEFLAIVGKSGSGKSTLLNVLGGIDRPTSGSVSVAGAAIEGLSENQLAHWRGGNLGFVFQFFQLMPTLTAAENVMLPMDFHKARPVRQRRAHALVLLERAGVLDQADKLPAALSGGQQQRVAIARALANDPPLLLADEPTGNLDSANASAVLDLFRGLGDAGTTIVIATHDRDIERVVDRVVSIADGVIDEQACAVASAA